MTKRIDITFESNGEGKLKCYSFGEFKCLGKANLKYPKDLTIRDPVHEKERVHHSREFGVDMHYAIRIWGQKGIYIHEGAATLANNGGPTGGCIHLGPGHAKKVYDWLDKRTRIVIKYPW